MIEMKRIGRLVGIGLMGRCPRCHKDIDLEAPSAHRCFVQEKWISCEIGHHGEIRIEASSKDLIHDLHARLATYGVIVP
ncbi:MAG: hypothetical protein WC819_03990 [Parcubacteria group bacterium]|jgi:hypothetical protein